MGVRDHWRYPEFLCGCKRPVEISRILVGRYHNHGYHVDLELGDKSWD